MLTWAVVGLLLVNLSLVTFLVIRKPMRPPGPGPKNLIIDRLGFTPDQIAQYEQLIEQHQTSIRQLNDDIRTTKNELYATLATDDQFQKDFLINRLGTLQQQVETAHYTHFMALKKLCTPSQQDRFRDLTSDLASYFAGPPKPPGRP